MVKGVAWFVDGDGAAGVKACVRGGSWLWVKRWIWARAWVAMEDDEVVRKGADGAAVCVVGLVRLPCKKRGMVDSSWGVCMIGSGKVWTNGEYACAGVWIVLMGMRG